MKIGIHPLFAGNKRIHEIIAQLKNLDIAVEIIETSNNYELVLQGTNGGDKLDFLLTPFALISYKESSNFKNMGLDGARSIQQRAISSQRCSGCKSTSLHSQKSRSILL